MNLKHLNTKDLKEFFFCSKNYCKLKSNIFIFNKKKKKQKKIQSRRNRASLVKTQPKENYDEREVKF